MRKKIFTLLIIILSVFNIGHAQNEFYYAIEFQALTTESLDKLDTNSNLLFKHEKKDWDNLCKFIKDPDGYISRPDVEIFDPSIYLKMKILEEKKTDTPKEGVRFDEVLGGNGHPANLLNMTPELVSNLLYATGQLLIEKANQELYNMYFKQLIVEFEKKRSFKYDKDAKGNIDSNISFTLKDLFPNSYNIIAQFDGFTQPPIGTSLKDAFELDLIYFYDNMKGYLLPSDIKNRWEFIFFDLTIESIYSLNRGLHPANVLKTMAFDYNELPKNSDLNSAEPNELLSLGLNMLNIISESLYSFSDETSNDYNSVKSFWVSNKSFSKLSSNGYKYYIYLLYLENKEIFELLGVESSNIKGDEFRILVDNLLVQVACIENISKQLENLNISTNKREGDNTKLINDYSQSFISLLDIMIPVLSEISNLGDDYFENYYKLKPAFNIALSIPTDIFKKEYGNAFLKTYSLGEKLYAVYNKGDSDIFGADADIIRYLTLANDIVQADSIDDMKNVLDAAILPVGSYSLKRDLNYTVSINGYVGLNGGIEHIMNNSYKSKIGWQIGPFAPIGIDCSWGTKRGHSNGIFLSIIDLGAVANMYFNGQDSVEVKGSNVTSTKKEIDVSTLPTLSFKNVFAPGLYYVHGFKKTPISLGVGIQLAPDLREVSISQGANVFTEDVIRGSFFIAVDIPLFTLSKGGKKKEKTNS